MKTLKEKTEFVIQTLDKANMFDDNDKTNDILREYMGDPDFVEIIKNIHQTAYDERYYVNGLINKRVEVQKEKTNNLICDTVITIRNRKIESLFN
jgi:hypothetical protein